MSVPYDTYSWSAARDYAGVDKAEDLDNQPQLIPFRHEDCNVTHAADGMNDEESWLLFGTMPDGRFFFGAASCDYTGFDCRGGGTVKVSKDSDMLISTYMTAEERRRLGL